MQNDKSTLFYPTPGVTFESLLGHFHSFCVSVELGARCPKDPAVLKVLRVINLLRVAFLVRRGDLLSRRTCADTIFLGITDILPLKEGSTA